MSVAEGVLAIIASFTSGLDVFRRFRELRDRDFQDRDGSRTKTKKKLFQRKPKTTSNGPSRPQHRERDDEESRLARSLLQGSDEIGQEYRRSIAAVGDRYALGDAIAHVSLADIQLRLNTGLVRIIHRFLSRDSGGSSSSKKQTGPTTVSPSLDYDSLIALSEQSRHDTVRTLRDLCRRLLHLSSPTLPVRALAAPSSPEKTKPQPKKTTATARPHPVSSPAKKKKKRIRQPTLARVYIANSNAPSQIAIVKPAERRRAKRPTAAATTPNLSGKTGGSGLATPPQSPPPAYTEYAGGGGGGAAAAAAAAAPTPASPTPIPAAAKKPPRPVVHARAHSQPSLLQTALAAGDAEAAPMRPAPAPPVPARKKVSGSHPAAVTTAPAVAPASSPDLLAWLDASAGTSNTTTNPASQPIYPPPPPPPRRDPQPPPRQQDHPAFRARKSIPTYHSAQTASTRLGEIPLHRWAEGWDFAAAEKANRAAVENGWPVRGSLVVAEERERMRELDAGAGGGRERREKRGFWGRVGRSLGK